MKIKSIMLAGAMLAASALGASATTLGASDFIITGQTTSGNCPTSETPCILLASNGPNSTATLTFAGGAFDLSGFLYSLQGTNSEVTATSAGGATVGTFVGTNVQGSITGLTADLTPVAGFTGITSVIFTNTGNGTVRVGGFSGASQMMAAVPLPASGLLLLGAIGLGWAARRKTA